MSPWKSHGCAHAVVHMDGDSRSFHCVHDDNKETHQDAPANFADTEMVIAAARNNGSVRRLAAFVLAPGRGPEHELEVAIFQLN